MVPALTFLPVHQFLTSASSCLSDGRHMCSHILFYFPSDRRYEDIVWCHLQGDVFLASCEFGILAAHLLGVSYKTLCWVRGILKCNWGMFLNWGFLVFIFFRVFVVVGCWDLQCHLEHTSFVWLMLYILENFAHAYSVMWSYPPHNFSLSMPSIDSTFPSQLHAFLFLCIGVGSATGAWEFYQWPHPR